MTGEVTVGGYMPGDEHGIDALYRSVFGAAWSLEAWTEKYWVEGVDPRPLLVLARDGDRIVGHSGSLLGRLRRPHPARAPREVVELSAAGAPAVGPAVRGWADSEESRRRSLGRNPP
ncbi:MAG: hypothetical protein JXQ29_02710 [Planctomycetes bacterium]|nr:hypothetical protein [Planctomycetota bacterium]